MTLTVLSVLMTGFLVFAAEDVSLFERKRDTFHFVSSHFTHLCMFHAILVNSAVLEVWRCCGQ